MSRIRSARTGPGPVQYRMPAEWERHEATWLAWPHNARHWDDLDEAQDAHAAIIAELTRAEKVYLLVPDASFEEPARRRALLKGANSRNLVFYRVPAQDVWIRDYGPITVREQGGKGQGARAGKKRVIVCWKFNAWGRKYKDLQKDNGIAEKLARRAGLPCVKPGIVLEGGSVDVNGAGTCLVTEQCLLNPNRNPRLGRAGIEGYLRKYLGAERTVWLAGGIAGDDTDGHVDDVARFTDKRTIVAAWEPDRKDKNHAVLCENRRRLQSARDPRGRPFRVVPCPMPRPVLHEGRRLPASYVNFYVSNKTVLVPLFGQKGEKRVIGLFKALFLGRRVAGVPSSVLVRGCGALHCVTQQLPA